MHFNEEKFDGFNATMQSLCFAPRAYYGEIIEGDAVMYHLQKVPTNGSLDVEAITYRLYVKTDFQKLIKDICRALIDALVNLTPIAQYSAKCLKAANHRDFLNVPSPHSQKIELHCWHIFVPKFLNQDRAPVLGDFLEGIDLEDPAVADPETDLTENSIISIANIVSDALPVTETKINLEVVDINSRTDLSVIRAVRDEDGKPVKYDEIPSAMETVMENFGTEVRIRRVKDFVRRYRPSGVAFLGGEDEEETRRQSIVNFATDKNPMNDTVENAFDIELDGDDTVISGGGRFERERHQSGS